MGVITWLFCLPKIATLGALLNFAGAFVASTIWPILLGLYHKKLTGTYAAIAMAAGTACGMIGYFAIGFYVAALVSCAVSGLICAVGIMTSQYNFDWKQLQEEDAHANE